MPLICTLSNPMDAPAGGSTIAINPPPSTEAALYYCCSEALQNAAKHGGPATTVTVAAHADEQTLNLTISDTGRGFDSATMGVGLTNMTDRLSAIGGQLVIDTGPGQGTRITATVDGSGS